MKGLARIHERLDIERIGCELWIDGSFLTQKIDPQDVDLALRLSAASYDEGCPTQRQAIEWVADNDERWRNDLCDTYVWFEYPEGHQHEDVGAEGRSYWMRWFGTARSGQPKGIAVIAIAGGLCI